jgi:hypothetical protein
MSVGQEGERSEREDGLHDSELWVSKNLVNCAWEQESKSWIDLFKTLPLPPVLLSRVVIHHRHQSTRSPLAISA